MIIIDDVLNPGLFEAITQTARSTPFYPLEREDSSSCFANECPNFFSKMLHGKLREELGEFREVENFFRLNTPDNDNHLRVHTDTHAFSGSVTHGVVFYIEIASGGTGFYNHKEYGARLPKDIDQPEEEFGNEDLWTFREFTEGKNNRMICYDADLFHMRHPITPTDTRIVWVSFVEKL